VLPLHRVPMSSQAGVMFVEGYWKRWDFIPNLLGKRPNREFRGELFGRRCACRSSRLLAIWPLWPVLGDA
jgi:hypothetical protein